MLLDDAALRQALLAFTDAFTDELFDGPHRKIVYPVSRMVTDPERFRDDRDEPMAKYGIGAVYSRDPFLRPFRCLSDARKEQLLQEFYDPHHRLLEAAVAEALAVAGECLLLDAHSFSATPLPYEPEQCPIRPDICLGTLEIHTPAWLSRMAHDHFTTRGFTVAFNYPYSGSIVPLSHWGDTRVHSLMVEVNRGTYMRPDGAKSTGFDHTRHTIAEFLDRLDA